jgi:hypothetical protein
MIILVIILWLIIGMYLTLVPENIDLVQFLACILLGPVLMAIAIVKIIKGDHYDDNDGI